MNLQHQQILAAARKRGLEIIPLEKFGEIHGHILRFHERQEIVVAGNFLSQLSLQNHLICNNKQLTKSIFSSLNIPSPRSLVFENFADNRPQITEFLKIADRFVCKPIDGTEGEGVAMHLQTADEIRDYWHTMRKKYKVFMLEAQIAGADLRLQAIGGKLAAACVREPAFVTGDGKSSVLELVENRRKIMFVQNPANRLDIDDITRELLEKQQLSLRSIPDIGQKVQLKHVANMSQGAVAIDVTGNIDPVFASWVEKFAGETGMSLFALDVIAQDYRQYSPGAAFALEVNPQPEWMHHTFSEIRTHDIAAMILADLFGV